MVSEMVGFNGFYFILNNTFLICIILNLNLCFRAKNYGETKTAD